MIKKGEPVTDDLRARLAKAIRTEFWNGGWENPPVWIVPSALDGIMPLVRAEIAASEKRGAELAAQAIEARRDELFVGFPPSERLEPVKQNLTQAARLARAAVPAPTGDNA